MITFENHHDGKTTYIMGNWCLNGCQIFHKDDAQKIFNKFNVSKKRQKDVMDSFYDQLTQDDLMVYDDFDIIHLQVINGIIFDEYIRHKYNTIRSLVAKYGTDEMRWQLIKDPSWAVRWSVARYGTNEMRLQLINDPDAYIREIVVIYGNDDIRKQLINDPSGQVRYAIAKHGNYEMRQKLINDCNSSVRNMVLFGENNI